MNNMFKNVKNTTPYSCTFSKNSRDIMKKLHMPEHPLNLVLNHSSNMLISKCLQKLERIAQTHSQRRHVFPTMYQTLHKSHQSSLLNRGYLVSQ